MQKPGRGLNALGGSPIYYESASSEILGCRFAGGTPDTVVANDRVMYAATHDTVPEAVFQCGRVRRAVEVKRLFDVEQHHRLVLAGGTKVKAALRDAFSIDELVLVLAVREDTSARACQRLECRAVEWLRAVETAVPVRVAVVPMPNVVFDGL